MGKTLATVGEIITAGVLIATGIGAAAGVAIGVGAAGGIAIAQSTIAIAGLSLSELSLIGIGLEAVGSFLQKPKVGGDYGTQVDWKANATTGVPYIVGRTGIAGNIVLQDVAGSNNKYLFVTTALSAAGPVKSVSGYLADNVLVAFNNDGGEGASGGQQTTTLNVGSGVGATVVQVASTQGFAGGQTITVGGESVVIKTVYANGSELQLKSPLALAHAAQAQVLGPTQTAFYANRMWRKVSLGPLNAPHLTFTATNSKDTPANHSGIPASWPASAKLSGIAHTIQAFEYDPAIYSTGEPTPMQVVEGVTAYDPRLDSTYAGGAGPQRSNDETTWGYSANPYIHALTWCLGRHVNGVRTVGVGAPVGAIDVAAFVNGANVADANKWTIGGQVYSTDGKWDVLTAFLQAGSGQPLKLGEMISCMVNAPLVSLDTLTGADVTGTASFAGTQASRDRINAIWPRYRDESAGWQIVPTDAPITVPAYATADGGQRTKEVEYTLASGGPDHVATLARYDIENSREAGPHILPCKPRWMGYKPGDCITVNEPEFGLNGQKCLILNRGQDPATMAVTLTLRTETDGKHAFALGETANAPATPELTGIDPSVVSVPAATDWAAIGGVSASVAGQSLPAILITGACPDPTIGQIIIEYRLAAGDVVAEWTTLTPNATSCTITGLAPQTAYVPRLRYRSVRGVVGDALELEAVTTGGVATDWASVTDPLETKPDNNATVGAKTGTNLKSSTGAVLGDADVITSEGMSASTASLPDGASLGSSGKTAADLIGDVASAISQAGSALTAAEAADTNVVTAQSTATLAAATGFGTLNLYPNFASYPDADASTYPGANTSNASGWFDGGSSGVTASRVAGQDGPYAYRKAAASGVGAALAANQDTSGRAWTPGFYVLEAHITLNSGTLLNAGLSARITAGNGGAGECSGGIDFYNSAPDGYSAAVGAGVAGQSYRYTSIVDLRTAAGTWWTLYLFTNGYGATGATARDITWHLAGLRPATAGEIAGTTALTQTGVNAAAITTEEEARVGEDSALGSRIDATNANVGANAAAITAEETARASGDAASASSLELLSAQVVSSPNLIPNGGLENGFAGLSSPGSAWNLELDGYWGQYAQTQLPPGVQVALLYPSFPVQAGRQYTLAGDEGLVGNVQLSDSVYLDCYVWPVKADADSANYAAVGTYDGPQNALSGYRDFSDTDANRQAGKITFTPSITGWARARVVAYSTSPSTNPAYARARLLKCETGGVATPYTAEGTAQQTNASVAVNQAATATLEGIAASQWVLDVQAGNKIAGIKVVAINGTVTNYSLIQLLAEIITLTNDVGGSPIDVLKAISGRAHFLAPIYLDVGSLRMILGPGFGASGSLVLWVGSNSYDETSATSANALFAIDENSNNLLGSGLPKGGNQIEVANASNTPVCVAAFVSAIPAGKVALSASGDTLDDGTNGTITVTGPWSIVASQGGASTTLASGTFTAYTHLNHSIYSIRALTLPASPVAMPYTGNGVSITLSFTLPSNTTGYFGCDLAATFYPN